MDVIKRGGDLTKMPTEKQLCLKTKEFLPKDMCVNSTSAKVNLKNLLEHTIHRLLLRPDINTDVIDGDRLEYICKIGSDGQTGLGKTARTKDHNDDQSFNQAICSLMIRRTGESRKILFRNENPGVCEHLRPLSKESVKDIDDVIIEGKKQVKRELEGVQEMTFNIDNKTVNVLITCIPSVHDGKNRKVILLCFYSLSVWLTC